MERNLVYDGINLLFIWYIEFKNSILFIVCYLVMIY